MLRLYIAEEIIAGHDIGLSVEQAHHLRNVMRLRAGDSVLVFNSNDGDWQAVLSVVDKKQCLVKVVQQIRPPIKTRALSLAFAPLKQDATNWLIEKATELGVTNFQPLIMDHSNTKKAQLDRYQKIAAEASAQCERQDIPTISPLMPLRDFLSNLPDDFTWLVAMERFDNNQEDSCAQKSHSILSVLFDDFSRSYENNLGLIIGPEGGFSKSEKDLIIKHNKVKTFSLGQRILRAETAAIAALSGCNIVYSV